MSEFSKKLKKMREKFKLTQGDLAEKTGLSQQLISQYENGIGRPKYPTLSLLSKALRCHPDELDSLYQYEDIHYEDKNLSCKITGREKCFFDSNADGHLKLILEECASLNKTEKIKVLEKVEELKQAKKDPLSNAG